MTSKVCPHCGTVVKNLPQHIKRQHPDKLEPANSPASLPANKPANIPANEPASEPLEIKPPEGASEEKTYHCVGCGYEGLTKGQNPCPSCGEMLDWSQVE